MRKALLAAASLLFGFALPGAPAIAAPDAAFLQDAVSGDNGQIALGRLAQSRGHSRATRSFGATLVRDHTMARNQALAAARKARTRVDSRTMNPDAAEARRELMRLEGREFDRAFARHMVKDHRDDIARFEMQTRGGDPLTARLARQTLPHLRHHLDLAQRLDR